jgi:hypothetical protein
MAGLYFRARNLSIRLNADQQHNLSADVHAASEFRVRRRHASNDRALAGCGERSAHAEGKASKSEKTRETMCVCQDNLHIQRFYRREGRLALAKLD